MSYQGVFDFYMGRIKAVPSYGFKSGSEILAVIMCCALSDKLLTLDECAIIINSCAQMHNKLLEVNYNDGWNEQNPQR